jgi:hypothetical protein
MSTIIGPYLVPDNEFNQSGSNAWITRDHCAIRSCVAFLKCLCPVAVTSAPESRDNQHADIKFHPFQLKSEFQNISNTEISKWPFYQCCLLMVTRLKILTSECSDRSLIFCNDNVNLRYTWHRLISS